VAERGPGALDHPRHDLELIARVAAGDGTAADARAASTLREACADCRNLDADLRAVAVATRELRSAAVAAAPRDFRLTAADAARLRRRGLGRLLEPRGWAGSRGMGRLGGGLVAIGLVGLVFGSGIVGTFGGLGAGAALPAAVPAYSASTPAATAATAATAGTAKDNATDGSVLAPVQTGLALQPAPSASRTQSARAAASVPSGPGAGPTTAGARDQSASGSPANPVPYVFLAAVAVGLGLLVAARYGRPAGR
jgi:hypothetical protein